MAKEVCPKCGKELSIFKTGLIYRYGRKRFCSIKCKNNYKSKKIGKTKDTQSKKVGKVFLWSFIIIEGFFIILAMPYIGEKPPFGFGSFGGFILVTIFSLIVAFIIAIIYGAGRRGAQIGEIIKAKHREISKKKK